MRRSSTRDNGKEDLVPVEGTRGLGWGGLVSRNSVDEAGLVPVVGEGGVGRRERGSWGVWGKVTRLNLNRTQLMNDGVGRIVGQVSNFYLFCVAQLQLEHTGTRA